MALVLGLTACACAANAGDGAPRAQAVAPTVRYARLTHQQWANSIRDLFRLDAAPQMAVEFRPDPSQSGFLFEASTEDMEVDQLLWASYERAAVDLAEQFTASTSQIAGLLPLSEGSEEARAHAFISEFGARVYRRPLSELEVERYLALHRTGRSLYPGLPEFNAGVRLVLEAMLQSPHFLYRVEASEVAAGDAISLGPYEIASRLSYFLWNTMPDDGLFAHAASGALSDPGRRESIVRSMIEDPRAEEVVARFHGLLFRTARFARISPSPGIYNGPATLGEAARHENELFVRDIFATGGGLSELLTASETFVNQPLAELYGLSGTFGDAFEKVRLVPSQRKGVLTQIGFLASNATSVASDPIHRGVFVAERIVCRTLEAPPANIPPLPPANGRTQREIVEAHTEQPGTVCASCHTEVINPYGFPFEGFDAVGRVREHDHGTPVDTQASPLIDGRSTWVEDALDLVDKLAASESVHDCYARHWVEFALGRRFLTDDQPLVAELGRESLRSSSIKTVLLSLVTSPAFSNRSAKELP